MELRLRGRFVSQAALLVGASGLQAVLSAAFMIVCGHVLGPAEYGTVTAALSLGTIFALLQGPIETGITKIAAICHGRGDRGGLASLTFGSLHGLLWPLALMTCGLALLAPVLSRVLNLGSVGALLAMTVYTSLSFLVCVPRGVLRGDHRFLEYGVNQVVEAAVRLALGVTIFATSGRAAGAMSAYALGMGGALVLSFWQLRDLRAEHPTTTNPPRAHASYGSLFFIYGYFTFIVTVDMLAAKRWLPSVEAGQYGAAGTIARFMSIAATPVYQLLFSRVTALEAAGKNARHLFVVVMFWMAVGLAASFFVPWFFGESILRWLLGPGFSAGAGPLRVLWVTTSIATLQAATVFALVGVNRIRGAWLFVVPCVLMLALLLFCHGSSMAIAWCGLGTSLTGMVILAAIAMCRGVAGPRDPVIPDRA